MAVFPMDFMIPIGLGLLVYIVVFHDKKKIMLFRSNLGNYLSFSYI